MGLGYIGLPTATLIAGRGFDVLGVDINEKVVEVINRGEIHFIEPGLKELVQQSVVKGNLRASTKPEAGDVYLIVVPTPFKENHEPDISYVENATRTVLPLLKKGDLFIIESTSPVMTTEKMSDIIFSERPELKGNIFVAYCPERVLPGNALYELEYNDRVIGGIDENSTSKACSFYSQFVKGTLHRTNARTAEMCKLVENSSRDVQIAFANELSIICAQNGINVWELIELANRHPRVHILQPGCGVGGHCIAVDPWFIIAQNPQQTHLIKQARDVNDNKAEWCINQIMESYNKFIADHNRVPTIACMGIAFKPDIDDLRESPAKYIASEVIARTKAKVFIVEPNIKEHNNFPIISLKQADEQADIVVWLVRHKEFLNKRLTSGKIELDFCGILKK